ncbi:MAG: TetR/AcrR family transcriptional regulator [Parvibaculaceae bacterium]
MTKIERREQILNAAITAFNEQGFAAVTMDLIAKTAATSKRTIYQLYADKNDILKDLLYYTGDKTVEAFGGIEIPAGPTGEALLATARRMFEICMGEELICMTRLLTSEAKEYSDHARVVIHRSNSEIVRVVKRYISKKIEIGEFIDEDPEILAELFVYPIIAMIERQYHAQIKDPANVEEIDHWLTACVRFYIRGCAAHSGVEAP